MHLAALTIGGFIRVIFIRIIRAVHHLKSRLYSTAQVCDATMMPLPQMPGTKKAPHYGVLRKIFDF
jgi:hypothetical protein